MPFLLAIVAVVLIVASLFADYKWRRWMEARRQDRNQDHGHDPSRPPR